MALPSPDLPGRPSPRPELALAAPVQESPGPVPPKALVVQHGKVNFLQTSGRPSRI